ncbi:uncharacterized protein LOC110835048 isoform X3 [Zootermopsis nevadensis]|uniref:uncharacterized protein LOC110835048 isoform X3 n=1 Tax=Zootermopsis nevadensis TaxID=136037 RepID=UPI000B8ECCCC|nr:uncharacterized protein LOC110835048 isoform X3 [Zootermopsis nevadensis]
MNPQRFVNDGKLVSCICLFLLKVDAQTHQQLLLQAELQAKKRELEELMRKDQGQTSAINQDVCSVISADKSETPGYSFLAEGTANATWGGSTQGTLDDLADQDNDIQEQSAGYSSDEAQDEEEEEDLAFRAGSLVQLNNSSNNKDPLSQTMTTTRDLLSMSLESSRLSLSGNMNTSHSNAASIAGSSSRVPPSAGSCSRSQRQGPASHNVWRKLSADSGTSGPRAIWTPSSHQMRQENLCTADELVSSSNNLDNNNSSSSATLHNTGLMSSNSSPSWWQQQALQLQHQLEVTSNLCQSMLLEQSQQQQHGNNLLTSVGVGNNLLPHWGFPPPPYPSTPHPQAHSVIAGGLGSHLLPANVTSLPDTYYQQLLAASQLQQQQMLLTTVNQCCQLLWLQQREIMALRSAVHALQEKTSCGNGSHGGESYSSPAVIGQPEEAILIASTQNSAHPTPHQSQSNLTRLQQTITNPNLTSFTPHQNLKLSYSGGLFQSPEEMTASSGVTSAHSLPNLSQTTTSANSVFSPHHPDAGPSNTPLNNVVPNFSPTPAHNFLAGTMTLPFPVNNNVNFNNRSQQQPLSSLIQCSAPQPGSGAPWLQHGAPGGTPGLLQGHTTPSPVPALNNQVPPGNRANNYWDNFRSYSRQNLLSTSTKSNEGVSHSPSPLVDRSHNTLRGSFSQSSSLVAVDPQSSTSILSQGIGGAIFSGPEQNMSRKEKLNTEQYQSTQDNISLPGPAHNNVSDATGLHYRLLETPGLSSCHPRSRDQHNFGDQPNISRPRAQRQILPNENILQDLHLQTNVSGIRSLVRCIPSTGGQQNFSSVPELHLESDITTDVRNISLAGQDVQRHQNFSLSSECLSSYQENQGSRNDELSEFSHIKTEGVSFPAVSKRKNPKPSLSSVSESQQKCISTCDSTANTTDQKPEHIGNALFEALSESVYSEVAALISANENRPHFLIQLFRDLQMISSDPLRQKTLQSIQEVVSLYHAAGTVQSRHKPQTVSQHSIQNENVADGNEHFVNGNAISSDEETVKEEGTHYHLAESLTSSLVGESNDAHYLLNAVAKCESVSRPHSIAKSEEGAAALLPSVHSPPQVFPRNAAWNVKDGFTLPTELPGRSSKLEVQAVLVNLLPFLRAHLDDTCSSSLLEAVRRLTLHFVPAQKLSLISSPTQYSSQPSHLGCCYQGQLDALLEDALLKFQGCRLRDISEELLTVVAEVLLSELTFLRLVDTVSRGDNNNLASLF